ncbi:GGDEF domain-containing response regulator [Agaribacter marinus]|uniref:diguanylate cyclase n=1 Tax=Agaribacter marinus TaxID=1431249 RepID=A0AA37SZF7_9ALTE|nr:diguanylate cyclase [Agaribacter marinus]GLR71444.1 hypothetical protein GCM10007852_23520 [Agaribacter marinus]
MDIPQEAVQRARVLIIDDEASQIMTIRSTLHADYEVSFACNTDDAYKLCHQFPQPDIILMDIVMPKCNGYQLCSMLKADAVTHDIPIIFISGNESAEDMAKGFNVGCVDYLVKPIRQTELKARIATHLSLNRQTRALERLAYQDPLTLVANRRKFNETLQREWARCTRYHQPLALLIVDLDDFKVINDNLGHSVGDQCLTTVAGILRNSIHRPGDMVARIGGDEFALIFSDFEPCAAETKCQSILDSVALIPPQKNAQGEYKLTLSMGMSIMYPDTKSDSFDAFQAADRVLYECKKSGKNRYELSKPYYTTESKLAHFK